MTRADALAIIEDALPHEREALRILSRPCLELEEGEEVVSDTIAVDGYSITRTVTLRRNP